MQNSTAMLAAPTDIPIKAGVPLNGDVWCIILGHLIRHTSLIEMFTNPDGSYNFIEISELPKKSRDYVLKDWRLVSQLHKKLSDKLFDEKDQPMKLDSLADDCSKIDPSKLLGTEIFLISPTTSECKFHQEPKNQNYYDYAAPAIKLLAELFKVICPDDKGTVASQSDT